MTDRPTDSTQPIKAWLLLRKSRRREEQSDPEALAKHRTALLRLAEADGISIPPDRIIEELRSGERLFSRPQFRGWLESLRQFPPPNGGLLYSVDVDRISRGVASERGYIQETIADAGIRIRTPSGITDLSNPDETLLYEVRGSLARHELQKYKARARAARDEMTLAGQLCTGTPAWGYRWDKNTGLPVPDPAKFPVLQAFCWQIHERSAYDLAKDHGLSHTTVWKALTNPMICGYPCRRYRTQTTTAGERRPVLLPRAEWIWPEKPGAYPAACTREEWEAIQAVIQSRWPRKGKSGYDDDGWCKDVVSFRGYAESARLSGRWQHRLTYAIDQKIDGGKVWILRGLVHAAAENAIRRALEAQGTVSALDRLSVEGPALKAPEIAPHAVEEQLAAERQRLADLVQLWADAEEEERPAIRQAQSVVTARVKSLKRELQASGRRGERDLALESVLPLLPLLVADWGEHWQAAAGSEKRLIVRGLIEEIEVVAGPVEGRRHWRREVAAVHLRSPFGERQ